MKLHSKTPLILILFLGITITSCLKDKAYDNGQIQSGAGHNSTTNVISLDINVSSASNFLLQSFNNSDNDTTVNLIPVTLGGTSAASQDIHVTLIADTTLIDTYNAENTDTTVTATNPDPTGVVTHYVVAPRFTILNGGVVTIPKGGRTGYLQITFKPSDYLGGDYAVAFGISSIAESGYTISGNLNTAIAAIGIKNQYDGKYGLTIETIGWTNYGIADGVTFTWPDNASLITAGATSVTISTTQLGSLVPAFSASGGATGFGATKPLFTFDPTTNKLIEVKNLVPDDGRGRTFHLNPAVTDSRFDPATKTVYAAFIMTQNGRPDQQFYDTLKYVGSR